MSPNPVGRPRQFNEEVALQAVMEVFWQKGFDGASLTDLCKATGLHKGSLYQAFGDKQQIFATALNYYTEQRFLEVVAVVSEASSPLTNLKAIVNRICTLMQEDTGCLIVNSMTAGLESQPEISKVLVGFYEKRLNALTEMITAAKQEGEIKPNLEPEALAEELMISLSGAGIAVKGPLGKENTVKAMLRLIEHWR